MSETKITLVGIVGTDGSAYSIRFPDSGGRLTVPVDQCTITDYGVTIDPDARIKVQTLPKTPSSIELTPFDPAASKHETFHICIGARPNLNIPGIVVDRNTGKIVGTYTAGPLKPPVEKDE